MGRIIAVANQKGGVGKTTTSINLSACLAEAGQRVLVVDVDPQGNTTSGLGVDKNNVENTIYEMMLGECTVEESIIKDVLENLDVMPSNVNLAGAEIDLIGIEDREYILKKAINSVRDNYDFIENQKSSTFWLGFFVISLDTTMISLRQVIVCIAKL